MLRWHAETVRGDVYACYIDHGDDFMGVYTCQNLASEVLLCRLLYVNYTLIKLLYTPRHMWND